MPRALRYTVDQVAKALKASGGLRSVTAQKLGCDRKTVTNYIARYKRLQEVEGEIVEQSLDLAEGKILTAMKGGDLTATIFYLKTKGKHRGYSERHQVEGPDGAAVPVAATFDFSDLSPAGLKAAEAMRAKLLEPPPDDC